MPTEWELTDLAIPFLRKYYKKIRRECPTLGLSTDLVLENDGVFTGVEAKINAKKKVLEQCNNLFGCMVVDYIYILWFSKVTKNLLDDCIKNNYGLFHYDFKNKNFSIKYLASKNTNIWRPQQKIWKEKIKLCDLV